MRGDFSRFTRRYAGEPARLVETINLFYPFIRLIYLRLHTAVRLIVIDSVTELTVRRILILFRRGCQYVF